MHQAKDRLVRQMKMFMYTLPLTTSLCLTSQVVCNYIVKLILFPLWLATATIFYFLSGYWLWKLTNISYYCDYVTITQYCCIMIGQQKNNRILYHPAAAAKSLQSCPTLCDPIDGSPPGSSVLGFSRQECWSGLPFPSPMHESEKWKWSHLVVADSSWPHGLQPTRLLCPWDFPGKSNGVGCHCLLHISP